MDEKLLQELRGMSDQIYLPDFSKLGTVDLLQDLILTTLSIEKFVTERYPYAGEEHVRDRERLTKVFLEIFVPYIQK